MFGSGRQVGMGGAYGALATGIDGSFVNPAGYAERAEQEIDWYEWELTGGIWLGGLFTRNDLDNDGRRESDVGDAYQASLGGRLQFGNFGLGLTAMTQVYDLHGDDADKEAEISFTTIRIGGAYAFFRGSLVTGISARLIQFEVGGLDGNDALVSFSGTGAEIGALVRPAWERYRVSLTVRTPASSRPKSETMVDTVDDVRSVRGLVLPREVHVPWEIDAGFAYQFGERRSNVPWRDTSELRTKLARQIAGGTYVAPPTYGGADYPALPEGLRAALHTAIANDREAERRLLRHQPRRYVLCSADLLVVGPTERGQSVAAFYEQEQRRSGRRASFGARFGAESEVWPNRLKLRSGTYLEPSRFARNYYRVHGTAGADVRLFDAFQWSIRGTATIDIAPRYFDWGLSLGLWY